MKPICYKGLKTIHQMEHIQSTLENACPLCFQYVLWPPLLPRVVLERSTFSPKSSKHCCLRENSSLCGEETQECSILKVIKKHRVQQPEKFNSIQLHYSRSKQWHGCQLQHRFIAKMYFVVYFLPKVLGSVVEQTLPEMFSIKE